MFADTFVLLLHLTILRAFWVSLQFMEHGGVQHLHDSTCSLCIRNPIPILGPVQVAITPESPLLPSGYPPSPDPPSSADPSTPFPDCPVSYGAASRVAETAAKVRCSGCRREECCLRCVSREVQEVITPRAAYARPSHLSRVCWQDPSSSCQSLFVARALVVSAEVRCSPKLISA